MPRTDLQVLLNEPIVITIGTAKNPRRVEVREPTNAELGEYMLLLHAAIARLVQGNLPLITAMWKGGDVGKHQLDLAELVTITDQVVAKVVGEPVEYVQQHMTIRQSTAIVHALLDVIGWDVIRDHFQQAAKAWTMAGKKAQPTPSEEAPSWSVGASSK